MSRPSHDGRWLESSCQSCQVVMAQNYWLELLRVRRAVNGLEPGCSGADIVPVRSRGPVEPAVSQHSTVTPLERREYRGRFTYEGAWALLVCIGTQAARARHAAPRATRSNGAVGFQTLFGLLAEKHAKR